MLTAALAIMILHTRGYTVMCATSSRKLKSSDIGGKMTVTRWFDLNKFRDFGYLQEVNRQFFHPLGLALAVTEDDETGDVVGIAGIIDNRNDPEGMFYADGIDPVKWKNVERARFYHACIRRARNPDLFDWEGRQKPGHTDSWF